MITMTPNAARPNDFFIILEGVGRFRFNRRTYGGQIRMDAEYARILGPNAPLADPARDQMMTLHANIVAHYNGLMVECPPGWEDLENIDLDAHPKIDEHIYDLYQRIKENLTSFRVGGSGAGGEQAGAPGGPGNGGDHGILGAAEVQPAADGPALAQPGA